MKRDCPDGPMRDLLPGFVHQALPATERARVAAHVAACPDCAAEAALIRSADAAFPVPALDVSHIVEAIPPVAARGGERWRAPSWLVAAVASFVLIGGGALFVRRNDFAPRHEDVAGVSIGGASRLTTEQLHLLLMAIDTVDALPSTEPEAMHRPLLYPGREMID